jgi:hypothetical protein
MDFWQYVKEGSDPMGVAVMLEDAAAVLGVSIAALGIGMTAATGHVVYDALATVTVGTIMGGVALTLVLKNRELLLSRSIPAERVQELNELLLDDEMVSMVHDAKAVVIGHDIVRCVVFFFYSFLFFFLSRPGALYRTSRCVLWHERCAHTRCLRLRLRTRLLLSLPLHGSRLAHLPASKRRSHSTAGRCLRSTSRTRRWTSTRSSSG